MEEPVVTELAAKYEKTPAQIILNWHIQRGYMVIPKTMTASRLAENLNVFQFKLTEEEYQQINDLQKGVRIFNPAGFTHANFFNTPYFN